MAARPFELRAGRWYALEMISPLEGEMRHFSAILVRGVEPLKSGKGWLWLDFYHANYPEGVRDKRYLLHVATRSPTCLVAEQIDEGERCQNGRVLLLLEITRAWIAQNFPDAELPDRLRADAVQGFLSRTLGVR